METKNTSTISRQNFIGQKIPFVYNSYMFQVYGKAIMRLNHYKRVLKKISYHFLSIECGSQCDMSFSLTYVYSGLA